MQIFQNGVRRTVLATGIFLSCLTLSAQIPTQRTISLSNVVVTARNVVPGNIPEYFYTISGSVQLEGYPSLRMIGATGSLSVGPGGTVSLKPVAYGSITDGYTDNALWVRIDVDTGFIVPGLSDTNANNLTIAILGGHGIYANAAGTFSVQLSQPAGAAAGLTMTGNGAFYTPSFNSPGVVGFAGSLGHLAVGGGWKTTIYVGGHQGGTAEIRFYDDAGDPLPLTIRFPQGGGSTVTAANVRIPTRSGDPIVMEAEGAPGSPLRTGSAQLWGTHGMGGYLAFRHVPTGQEAIAPVQRVRAGTYYMNFDNTGGLSTGLAISSVVPSPADVFISVTTDEGASWSLGELTLPKNGHTSFVLAERYPDTAGKRGVLYIRSNDSGRFGQIGLVGIRGSGTGAFTSLPIVFD